MRLIGADEAHTAWDAACRSIGLPRPGRALSARELLQAAAALATRKPLSVAARSFGIRMNSYLMLNERQSR